MSIDIRCPYGVYEYEVSVSFPYLTTTTPGNKHLPMVGDTFKRAFIDNHNQAGILLTPTFPSN
jgi:hypothetical protein